MFDDFFFYFSLNFLFVKGKYDVGILYKDWGLIMLMDFEDWKGSFKELIICFFMLDKSCFRYLLKRHKGI